MTKDKGFFENAGHKSVFLVLAAFVGAAFAAAPTNEGGSFAYTGSPADMRTTSQTGDQTWTLASSATIGSFYPGQTDIVQYWQIFAGASITATGKDRVMKGNVVFENALKWTGEENYVGLTGPAKLLLRNGGSLTVTNEHLRIGQKYNDSTESNGAVFMEAPSALTMVGGNVIAGNTKPGAIWMDGGALSVTNGVLKTGGTAGQDGYIRVNGGAVSLGSGEADILNVGSTNNYGSLHISGGSLATRRTGTSGEVYAKLGLTANKAADVYVDGGILDLWNERLGIGYWTSSGVSGGRASLTVDGDGRVVVNTIALGRTGSGNDAVVNLNGGRLELTKQMAGYGNTGNAKFVNFDGGTLALVRDSRPPADIAALGPAGEKVVYPGGATIEVPAGISAPVSATFRAAKGWGVAEISLTNPGSGYVTAPKVTISGGSGERASAYAVMNKDRTIGKIVVTCRGEGYAEGDAVAVVIESTTGSGAAAVATLAPNAGGVVRKTGEGTWVQNTNDNAFDGVMEVLEGALECNGAGFPNATLKVAEGASLLSATGTASSLGDLVVTNGIFGIKADGATGTAALTFGSLSVNQGLALVTHTNGLSLALTATDLTATSSAESPVVNGMVYANKDASAYRKPLPIERRGDGTLVPVVTTTSPGPDANWRPTTSISEANALGVDAVNSIILPLTPAVECYVKNAGLVEVKSGMIVSQRPHGDGLQRMEVTGGGAFTTHAKGGMFIYGDGYLTGRRSNSLANDNAVHFGNWRRLYGPFADPDASTPMSLTVAGEKAARPELGAQAWLLGEQTFSGGLNLVNGGVFIWSDAGLGASGSPVRASGYCSISAYNWTFVLSHPIELLDGSALIFSPAYGNQGNTVSGALSGAGDLLTSDVNRRGYAMAFTGDHSAFIGDYYVQGHARIAPATFSPLAGICLADGTNGVGVIETSGTFMRAAGTGKGEVCWKTHKAYAGLGYGLRGGFAARGGNLTVNLGGVGAKLTVGADYLPDGTVIQLQSQYADGTLTFMNGFELGGKTQKVNVWTGKTATFAGALSDADGGGALAVTGNLALDGATLEIGAANLAAPMLAVDGALTLAGTLNLALDVTKEELSANGDVTLATATGGIGGTVVLSGNVPASWTVLARANSLVLKKLGGTAITIK